MATGTDTFMGLAAPLQGEFEIKQVAGDEATDIVTISGSTGTLTGDFLVARLGDGTEKFVVSASGGMTSAAGATFAGNIANTLSSTAANAFTISVTSTGAIATGTATGSVLYVQASSKSVMNSVVSYVSMSTGGEVGTCQSMLLTHGSKAPTYLLVTGATAAGVGAVGSNGFVLTGLYLTSALATTVPITALRVLLGSGEYYIPCYTTTTLS